MKILESLTLLAKASQNTDAVEDWLSVEVVEAVDVTLWKRVPRLTVSVTMKD